MSNRVQPTQSQRQLVLQLRKLAQIPAHCRALVSNSDCLKSLVGTLESPDQDTILIALITLITICQTPAYKQRLNQICPELKQKLRFLKDSPNERLASASNRLWAKLQPKMAPLTTQNRRVQRKQSVNTRSSQHLQTLTLTVQNLDSTSERNRLSQLVVKFFPHILSVTCDVRFHKATFYCTKTPDATELIKFLREKKFQVDTVAGKENTPIKAHRRNQITRFKGNHNKTETLTERLARQRLEKENKKKEETKANTWFSAAASYLW